MAIPKAELAKHAQLETERIEKEKARIEKQ